MERLGAGNQTTERINAVREHSSRMERELREKILRETTNKESHFASNALREHVSQGARELGGPVSANAAYRVNERGPELLKVADKEYLMMGNQPGSVKSASESANRGLGRVPENERFPTGRKGKVSLC
ncbi:hypothetical protein [Pseudoduganella violaceinigra]|uniref:hypothetical protein n=1 Tax=Pseudoduganella violaceinigra TaxID=246602 RepID=UPI000489A8AB|nr:hypothetical protein [Pseudoduganella violaceinigra]